MARSGGNESGGGGSGGGGGGSADDASELARMRARTELGLTPFLEPQQLAGNFLLRIFQVYIVFVLQNKRVSCDRLFFRVGCCSLWSL